MTNVLQATLTRLLGSQDSLFCINCGARSVSIMLHFAYQEKVISHFCVWPPLHMFGSPPQIGLWWSVVSFVFAATATVWLFKRLSSYAGARPILTKS